MACVLNHSDLIICGQEVGAEAVKIPGLHKFVRKVNKNVYEIAGNQLQLAFRDKSVLVRVGGGKAQVIVVLSKNCNINF
jgi:hypothetical protein